ncbi:MAG: trypsin-like peptidase domain-containing protein [Candidatus Kerfeldbacteria bacterium]|nr:trypsin-like peptidase domain-containing protein [Candidatus Kerfeldbacteria bacterium]
MEDIPGPRPTPPTPTNVSLIATVMISVLIGGLAGGLVALKIDRTSPTTTSGTNQTRTVEEDSATVDVVERASPAVVSIIISKDYSKVYGQESPFDNFFGFPTTQRPQGQQEIGGGSGFIVRSDGLIVTNKHVVSDDQASYTVVMNDGKRYDAKVLATDPTNDVAVVKIEAKDLPTLPFGDSNGVIIGQSVIAIGNALGEYRNTVTKGIISGKSRTITAGDASGKTETLEDVFQTDAAINPGNSGGPLLDLDGNVIAINTAVNQSGQLIGFAIPGNVVKRDIASVEASGKISRPFLGVRYVLITQALADQNKLPANHGALIQADGDSVAVVPGSPADKAGLVENDIILSLNGSDITVDHTLTGALNQLNVGDTVKLKVYHKGETKEISVTLEERK